MRVEDGRQALLEAGQDGADATEAQNRAALGLSGGAGSVADTPLERSSTMSAERRQVQNSTDQLDASTAKLREAQRTIAECEDIGQGVLSDLFQQRETIQRARDNMRTIDNELTDARRALNRMINHAQKNRVVMMIVMALLGTVLAFFGLTVLGLPLKYNIAAAVGLVVLCTLAVFLRRYLQRRRALREAAIAEAEAASGGSRFSRAASTAASAAGLAWRP